MKENLKKFANPQWMRRLDRWMLLNMPDVWETRLHYLVLYSLVSYIASIFILKLMLEPSIFPYFIDKPLPISRATFGHCFGEGFGDTSKLFADLPESISTRERICISTVFDDAIQKLRAKSADFVTQKISLFSTIGLILIIISILFWMRIQFRFSFVRENGDLSRYSRVKEILIYGIGILLMMGNIVLCFALLRFPSEMQSYADFDTHNRNCVKVNPLEIKLVPLDDPDFPPSSSEGEWWRLKDDSVVNKDCKQQAVYSGYHQGIDHILSLRARNMSTTENIVAWYLYVISIGSYLSFVRKRLSSTDFIFALLITFVLIPILIILVPFTVSAVLRIQTIFISDNSFFVASLIVCVIATIITKRVLQLRIYSRSSLYCLVGLPIWSGFALFLFTTSSWVIKPLSNSGGLTSDFQLFAFMLGSLFFVPIFSALDRRFTYLMSLPKAK